MTHCDPSLFGRWGETWGCPEISISVWAIDERNMQADKTEFVYLLFFNVCDSELKEGETTAPPGFSNSDDDGLPDRCHVSTSCRTFVICMQMIEMIRHIDQVETRADGFIYLMQYNTVVCSFWKMMFSCSWFCLLQSDSSLTHRRLRSCAVGHGEQHAQVAEQFCRISFFVGCSEQGSPTPSRGLSYLRESVSYKERTRNVGCCSG